MKRILVCGGRDYRNVAKVHEVLDKHYTDNDEDICIIQGGAQGADAIALRWAVNAEVPVVTHYANWRKFNKAAGPFRNQAMLTEWGPHLVIAFPGGPGTLHMMKLANRKGIPLQVVHDE